MISTRAIAGSSRSTWRYAIVMLAFLLIASGTYWYWQFGPTAFDSAVWRNGDTVPASADAPRLRMADGLLWFGRLSGQPRTSVAELLGPPTPTVKWRDWDLVYWLGAERGFIGIDSEWLVIRFNGDGVVTDARIVHD